MRFVAELLAGHVLDGFRSGKDDLDAWLRRSARSAVGQGTRTWVVVDASNEVVGYFAVAPHLVDREHLPRSIARGAPQIPAVLLAKLALAESLHGQGLGSEDRRLVIKLSTVANALGIEWP